MHIDKPTPPAGRVVSESTTIDDSKASFIDPLWRAGKLLVRALIAARSVSADHRERGKPNKDS